MNPAQLNAAQLAHAIKTFEQRVEAKRAEAYAMNVFAIEAKNTIAELLPESGRVSALQDAAEKYCVSQRTMALIDLEVFELQLTMLKSQQLGIVGASGVIIR